MKISRFFAAGLLSLLVLPATLSAADNAKIDPRALEILKRMSTTLSNAHGFTYQSKSILEVPAETGQFLTLFSTADVALQRPNKLRARMAGEAPRFDFNYDGSTVSAYAPDNNVYSQIPAPATIDAMLPGLEEETGIRFATTPLLMSDPYPHLTKGLTSGIVVGPVVVHGTLCNHLAFRSPGVNWEIWVEAGNRAVPRRLAVTFTNRKNYPRTIVEFSRWNLNPWLPSGKFVFRKPADATKIPYNAVLKSTGR